MDGTKDKGRKVEWSEYHASGTRELGSALELVVSAETTPLLGLEESTVSGDSDVLAGCIEAGSRVRMRPILSFKTFIMTIQHTFLSTPNMK